MRNYLEGIYNTILIKDVATRKQISAISMLQSVVEYMYDNIDISGVKFDYLANYITELGIHGIPYVKGPYILPAPGANYGKFLLKWV